MTEECPDPGGGWASRRTNPALLLLAQVVGRFAFQHGETRVVVGELRQVGECDLAGDDRIVRADVGLRVPGAMLELPAEPHPELLKIAPQRPEVDPELRRNGARLIFREIPLGGQLNCSHCRLPGCHCLLPCSLDRPTSTTTGSGRRWASPAGYLRQPVRSLVPAPRVGRHWQSELRS